MEEKTFEELSVPKESCAKAGEPARENAESEQLFRGVNLIEMAKALKTPLPLRTNRIVETTRQTTATRSEVPVVEERPVGSFPGLDLAAMAAALKASRPPVHGASVSPNGMSSAEAMSPDEPVARIATADVVASLLSLKRNKRVKTSTLKTYEKRLRHFQRQFPWLAEASDPIIQYLAQFDGDTGRHRRDIQDLLVMLYDHAVKRFGLPRSPMVDLERAMVHSRPIRPLSLDQARVLFQTSRDEVMEAAAVDLMAGHGWRQIEVRRVLAEHVTAMSDGIIEVDGKERKEMTPVMPETEARLRFLAKELKLGDHVFRSRRRRGGRTQPLGEKGMANLVQRQLMRAGIDGATGHDLRRTFASLVRRAGADEFLTMRLLRDIMPGSGKRYFGVSAEELSADLLKYSPLSLVKGMPVGPLRADDNVLPVQRNQNVRQTASAEAGIDEVVEARESSGHNNQESLVLA